MTVVPPAAALARSLQEKLGTADLAAPSVLAAVDRVIRELAAHYQSRVSDLEAQIARRDAVDRYREALGQASAILHDRPEVIPHLTLAADMILLGVELAGVRCAIIEMGGRPCA